MKDILHKQNVTMNEFDKLHLLLRFFIIEWYFRSVIMCITWYLCTHESCRNLDQHMWSDKFHSSIKIMLYTRWQFLNLSSNQINVINMIYLKSVRTVRLSNELNTKKCESLQMLHIFWPIPDIWLKCIISQVTIKLKDY